MLDEPCSALDPISTAKIEELIDELKNDYTIVIVTHNMQQAARVSDFTAFMYLGELVEFGETTKIFTTPDDQPHARLHHRTLRLGASVGTPEPRTKIMTEHTAKAFDGDLQDLSRMVAEMGGLAEKQIADSVDALAKRDSALAQRITQADANIDALQREIEEKAINTIARRQPMAVDLREIVGALRLANDLERIGDLAKNIAKRVIALNGEFPPPKLIRGVEHMTDLVLGQLKAVLDAYARRDITKAMAVWRGDEEIDAVCTSVFRELLTYMMEDPAQHYVLHPLDVLRQEHRADGRPRHQHCRDGALRDRRPADRRPAAEG